MRSIRVLPLLTGLLLAGLPAAPLAAQEQDVARGSYPYFQRSLTIAVNAGVPGELQVVRSRSARIDVAALAAPGVATFALGGYRGNELMLTAAGADRAVFIVTVPERVYVSIRAPGTSRSLGSFRPIETVQWGAENEARATPAPQAPPVLPPEGNGYFSVYGADDVPATIVIPSLAAIDRINVHMHGSTFRLAATRPLQVSGGRGDQLVINLTGQPLDLLLELPAGTQNFRIVADGDVVLSVRNGGVAHYCTPALAQDLGENGIRVMLTPLGDRLECGATQRSAMARDPAA